MPDTKEKEVTATNEAIAQLTHIEDSDRPRHTPILKVYPDIGTLVASAKEGIKKINVSAKTNVTETDTIISAYNALNDAIYILDRRAEPPFNPPPIPAPYNRVRPNGKFAPANDPTDQEGKKIAEDAKKAYEELTKNEKTMARDLRKVMQTLNVPDSDLTNPMPLQKTTLVADPKTKFVPAASLEDPVMVKKYVALSVHEMMRNISKQNPIMEKTLYDPLRTARDEQAKLIAKDGTLNATSLGVVKDNLAKAQISSKLFEKNDKDRDIGAIGHTVTVGVDQVLDALNKRGGVAPKQEKPKEITPKVEKPKESQRVGAGAVKAIMLATDIKSGIPPIKFEDAVADIGIQRAFEKMHNVASDMLTPDLSAVNAAKMKELQPSFKEAFITATEKVEAIGNSKTASENDKKNAEKLQKTLGSIKENAAGVEGLQLSQAQQSQHEFAGLIADNAKLVQLTWSPTDGPQGLAAAGPSVKKGKIILG